MSAKNKPIRVYVVDDHAIVRVGLRQLLGSVEDIEVVGEAKDGREALNFLEKGEVDVLVLDLSLPKVDGSEVLRRIRKERPDVKVFILSMYPEDQHAQRLMGEGAKGYLSKDGSPDVLVAAIRKIADGGTWFSQHLTPVGGFSLPPRAPHETLASREYQVFTLIIQGRSVSDIAAELDLAISTVSNYLRAVKDKLGVENVAEIVTYAHRAGLMG